MPGDGKLTAVETGVLVTLLPGVYLVTEPAMEGEEWLNRGFAFPGVCILDASVTGTVTVRAVLVLAVLV